MNDDDNITVPADYIKALKAKAAEGEEARRAMLELLHQRSFIRAGVDPDTPEGQQFMHEHADLAGDVDGLRVELWISGLPRGAMLDWACDG